MWRQAVPADDEDLVRMCGALNAEDPGPDPVPPENMRRTLEAWRRTPERGRAIVLDLSGALSGYALLAAFWSNELGGDVCTIDELYVVPSHRGAGHGTRLLEDLASRRGPWLTGVVALALEASPSNVRAQRFYERLGFRAGNIAMQYRLPPPRR